MHTLTNIRRYVTLRATLRGRQVEFLWDDGHGRRLGSAPRHSRPLIVDCLTREPLRWELTPDEDAALQEAIVAP